MDNWPRENVWRPSERTPQNLEARFGAVVPIDVMRFGSVLDNPETLGRPPTRGRDNPDNPFRSGYAGPSFGAKRVTYVKRGADGILRGYNGLEGMGGVSTPVASPLSGFGALGQIISTTISTLTTSPVLLLLGGGAVVVYFATRKKKRR